MELLILVNELVETLGERIGKEQAIKAVKNNLANQAEKRNKVKMEVNGEDKEFTVEELKAAWKYIGKQEVVKVEVKNESMKLTNCEFDVPKKYQHMIKEIDFESREDGYWVYLNDGFASENGFGSKTIHEYTKADVLKQIRKCVEVEK